MKRFDLPRYGLVVLLLRPVSRVTVSAVAALLGVGGLALGVMGASRNSAGSVAIVLGAGLAMVLNAAAVLAFSSIVIERGGIRSARSHGWVRIDQIVDIRVERAGRRDSAVVDTTAGTRRLWAAGTSVLDELVSGSWRAADPVQYLQKELPSHATD